MGTQLRVSSESEPETEVIAAVFGTLLKGGETVSLEGDLGAGKTFFTRALARSLGVLDNVTSPTFVLQKSYKAPSRTGIRHIVHYDLYRLNSYRELLDLGFDEIESGTIVLAEWGDKFVEHFPSPLIRVRIEQPAQGGREFIFEGLTREEQQLLSAGIARSAARRTGATENSSLE